jgi:pilus assembly protein Flp/PilA
MLKNLMTRVRKDEEGATLVEYTLLLGMVTAGVVGVIAVIGPWVTLQWGNLRTALGL